MREKPLTYQLILQDAVRKATKTKQVIEQDGIAQYVAVSV